MIIRYLLLLIFIFFETKIYAQTAYKAVYDQSVFSLDTTENLNESNILKYITDRSDLLSFCNEQYNKLQEVSSVDNKEVKVNRKNTLIATQNGEAFRIIDYSAYKEIFFENRPNDKKVVTCIVIDTTKLRFTETQEFKIINKWKCTKYISNLEENRDITIWVSKELPWFVNPGIILMNVNAGIVAIEYNKKGKIVLKAIEKTDIKPDPPITYNCTSEPMEMYNILNTEMRYY